MYNNFEDETARASPAASEVDSRRINALTRRDVVGRLRIDTAIAALCERSFLRLPARVMLPDTRDTFVAEFRA